MGYGMLLEGMKLTIEHDSLAREISDLAQRGLQEDSRLKSSCRDFFVTGTGELYESVYRLFGGFIIHHRKQPVLRERVKELTCLYGIIRLVDRTDISLSGVLQSVVELLSPAWVYPRLLLRESPWNWEAFLCLKRDHRPSCENDVGISLSRSEKKTDGNFNEQRTDLRVD